MEGVLRIPTRVKVFKYQFADRKKLKLQSLISEMKIIRSFSELKQN